MIEPRCLIKSEGRSRLLRDDFAVGENGFIRPTLASHSEARTTGNREPAAAGLPSGASQSHGGAIWACGCRYLRVNPPPENAVSQIQSDRRGVGAISR
jgi:hypothetical protein